LCLTNKEKRILYISKCYEGSLHDYNILQDCFAPHVSWFKHKTVRLDLGFQGFKEKYRCKKVYMPYKRKRVRKGENNELNEEQKTQNKEQAAERIKVEHSIGGIKRYRILSHRMTLKSNAIINCIIGVCAGLWNFVLK
jgi:DNA repair exonuclease SbcCD nuclease subunit